jgi:prepilin-type N-terminal cleavage/methylation domain-containing protein
MRNANLKFQISNPASRRYGLSLVEVMISTALSAILLTAAGAAYSASTMAIENNDRFFTASQGARVAIGQMMAACRRAQSAPKMAVTATSARLTTFDGHDRTYQYNSAAQQLQMVDNNAAGTPMYILARNVTAATFNADLDAGSNVLRISISVTVNVNGNQILLTGAAAPRGNVVYN